MNLSGGFPVPGSAAAALHRAMPLSRLSDCGMDDTDAAALHARTAAGEDWADVAAAQASARLGKARSALGKGHLITAVTQARWAAGAAWSAQLADHQDTARKRALYKSFTKTISFVASLDGMQRVEIPYRSGLLTGWLRCPETRPVAGTVIVCGGLSNWAPAQLRTADAITARGLACLLAEGPGQGEPRLEHGLYMDERAADGFARFVDTVIADATLRGPVGILGNSLGGLFAALVAAADPRVAACVVNGAPPAPAAANGFRFGSLQEQLTVSFGSPEGGALKAALQTLRFDPALKPIKCPVLSLHGAADRIVSRDEAQAFADASPQGRLESWPDGEHTIYNHARERDALVADWLADELRNKADADESDRSAGKA
jgi:alpha-beta hydrolase superfamily lysophospholipase